MKVTNIFRQNIVKAQKKPVNSSSPCSKFLVMEAPTLISESGTYPPGDYRLVEIEGNVTITGENKQVFIISPVFGSGTLTLENVVLMTNSISSSCKLVVNLINCQVISETIKLENVQLNILNSSMLCYPREDKAIISVESQVKAKNVNFTLVTWVNDITFFDETSSSWLITSSEFVVIGSLPTQTLNLTLLSGNSGTIEITNSKAYFVIGQGTIKFYTLENTPLVIDGLEIESTIKQVVESTPNNSPVNLSGIVLNGEDITSVPPSLEINKFAFSEGIFCTIPPTKPTMPPTKPAMPAMQVKPTMPPTKPIMPAMQVKPTMPPPMQAKPAVSYNQTYKTVNKGRERKYKYKKDPSSSCEEKPRRHRK